MKQAAPPAWSMPTQPKGQAVSSFKVTKKLQLLLEQVPIRSRTEQLVGVQVGYGEKALQSQVKAAGGVWDPAFRTGNCRSAQPGGWVFLTAYVC